VPDVDEEHARADSAITEPSYANLGVAVPRVTQRYASLPVRDHYEVLVSCAGPTSVGYALGNAVTGTGTSLDGTFITEVSGEVSCDGLVHRDVFDLALPSGAELYVSADEQTAWSVAVNGDAPPIRTEPDGSDWTMSSAIGPMLDLDGSVQLTTLIGADDGGDIRVVIACEGDGLLKIAVDTGPVEGVNVDRFELVCEAGSTATIRKEYPKASPSVTISMDPGGRRMWLAATVQVRPSRP
jgi:hypothetical protein